MGLTERLTEARRIAYRTGAQRLVEACREAELPPDLVTIMQAAVVHRITPGGLRDKVRTGKLRGWHVGNRWLVSLSEVSRRLTPSRPAGTVERETRPEAEGWRPEWKRKQLRSIRSIRRWRKRVKENARAGMEE